MQQYMVANTCEMVGTALRDKGWGQECIDQVLDLVGDAIGFAAMEEDYNPEAMGQFGKDYGKPLPDVLDEDDVVLMSFPTPQAAAWAATEATNTNDVHFDGDFGQDEGEGEWGFGNDVWSVVAHADGSATLAIPRKYHGKTREAAASRVSY